MPVTSLSKLLGHSQMTTTQIYTAGADPELAKPIRPPCSTWQRSRPSHPHHPAALRQQWVAGTDCAASAGQVVATEPELPDWAAWAPDLPEAIRQASLDYVQRRLHTWPPRRRRDRALNLLRELRGLWHWFLAQRPIAHPGELGLQDLWAYQTDQQTQGYAAGTINRRLDYVVGIVGNWPNASSPSITASFACVTCHDRKVYRAIDRRREERLETYLHQRGHARPPPAA